MDEDLFESTERLFESLRNKNVSLMNENYDTFYKAAVQIEVLYLTRAVEDQSFESLTFAKACRKYLDEFPEIPLKISRDKYSESFEKFKNDQIKIESLNQMLSEALANL